MASLVRDTTSHAVQKPIESTMWKDQCYLPCCVRSLGLCVDLYQIVFDKLSSLVSRPSQFDSLVAMQTHCSNNSNNPKQDAANNQINDLEQQ
jgi:hypothetical protein